MLTRAVLLVCGLIGVRRLNEACGRGFLGGSVLFGPATEFFFAISKSPFRLEVSARKSGTALRGPARFPPDDRNPGRRDRMVYLIQLGYRRFYWGGEVRPSFQMKSSEVARLASVTVETLRFYERKDLMRKPARTPSGYRNYTEADLERIRFIRDCQSFGFTLADIKPLMHLHGLFGNKPEGKPGDRMMAILEDRLAEIDSKLRALQRMREHLAAALRESQSRHAPVCPAAKLKKQQQEIT